jgi:hypothetical protein
MTQRRWWNIARPALLLVLVATLITHGTRSVSRTGRRVMSLAGGEAREVLRLGASMQTIEFGSVRWSGDDRWFVQSLGAAWPTPVRRVLRPLWREEPVFTWWVSPTQNTVCLGPRVSIPLATGVLVTTRSPDQHGFAPWGTPLAPRGSQPQIIVWGSHGFRGVAPPASAVAITPGSSRRPRAATVPELETANSSQMIQLAIDAPPPPPRETAGDLMAFAEEIHPSWWLVWYRPSQRDDWVLHPVRLRRPTTNYSQRGRAITSARLATLPLKVTDRHRFYAFGLSLSPTLDHVTFVYDGGLWLLRLRKPLPQLATERGAVTVDRGVDLQPRASRPVR